MAALKILAACLGVLLLAACGSPPPAQPPRRPAAVVVVPPPPGGPAGDQPALVSRYDCGGTMVAVRLDDGFAVIEGLPRGTERLGRDAGGVTPQQQVFSSPSLRAEFGAGADSREATLHYLNPPLVLHCRRA